MTLDSNRILAHLANKRAVEIESLGLPDLLFEQKGTESLLEYHTKQDQILKEFVESDLKFRKRGAWRSIKLIPKQLEFIADFFFERVNQGICWKSRGTGGSLCAAVIAWLSMVYLRKSFTDVAGSAEQAVQLYDYTVDFWDCLPRTKELLKSEPTTKKTELIDGTFLKCLANSQTAVRSKHPEGLICDEACQADADKDNNLKDAMQMPLSEEDHIILILSTFHVAGSYFEILWDTAEKKGLKKYSWSIWDCMQRCTDDCKDCPLTFEEPVTDATGTIIKFEKRGCAGRAKKSDGWVTKKQVIAALNLNEGTDKFWTEWNNDRPQTRGPVYPPDKIVKAFVDFEPANIPRFQVQTIEEEEKRIPYEQAVGIDWGWASETAVIGPLRLVLPDIYGFEERYFTSTGTDEIQKYLEDLAETYGSFDIYPDSSHPFNNMELAQAGYNVIPVVFKAWKAFGVGNVAKWLWRERLKLHQKMELLKSYLQKYHKDETGKPKKTPIDHGPDALLCGLMKFIYPDEAVQGGEQETDVWVF